jgi:hypothetical protein
VALPDYFARNSTAALQAVSGMDRNAFLQQVEDTSIGISLGRPATSYQGSLIAEMLVRLVVRFYPRLAIHAARGTSNLRDELAALAVAINPNIELDEGDATVNLLVGKAGSKQEAPAIHVGSTGWTALVSDSERMPLGSSRVPFGAGGAACLAAAMAFSAIFERGNHLPPHRSREVSLLTRQGITSPQEPEPFPIDLGEFTLVGNGAIGNAAVWALSKAEVLGTIHLVDHEQIDLGNLQRYVLGRRADEGAAKVAVAQRALVGGLVGACHYESWSDFTAAYGPYLDRVLLALDTARDRRAVQASLPRWIANAWTQPGDLGLSVHPKFSHGACVCCLYLPAGERASDDVVIAGALGIPERVRDVRLALYSGDPISIALLEVIAERLGVSRASVAAFEGRSIRALYSEGVCGGAVLSLERAALPAEQLHVPLAPQSAFAGMLLASSIVADSVRSRQPSTTVTHLNILRPFGELLTAHASPDPRGICICQDPDFVARYQEKYHQAA